jgi:hypothetical protein
MRMSALIVVLLSQTSPDAWKVMSQQDGVTLESRPVKDSDYLEYRATADTDVAVEPLCDKIYEWGSLSKDHDNIKSRKVLEDNGDTRVVYDQLEPPMVSHRDFAFTLHKTPGGPQRCAIDFFISNDKAPPLPPGWVRMQKLKGSWRFERTAKGTHVVYTNFSDPGGSLPSIFVHGSQRDSAVETIKKGIKLGHGDPSATSK